MEDLREKPFPKVIRNCLKSPARPSPGPVTGKELELDCSLGEKPELSRVQSNLSVPAGGLGRLPKLPWCSASCCKTFK